MSRLAIIIPAYNEELTIKATLVDYFNHFPDAYFGVIDNNSSVCYRTHSLTHFEMDI
jgi:hypothetical protein